MSTGTETIISHVAIPKGNSPGVIIVPAKNFTSTIPNTKGGVTKTVTYTVQDGNVTNVIKN